MACPDLASWMDPCLHSWSAGLFLSGVSGSRLKNPNSENRFGLGVAPEARLTESSFLAVVSLPKTASRYSRLELGTASTTSAPARFFCRLAVSRMETISGYEAPKLAVCRTTSAKSRVVVILTSASPNRLGTILLTSIFSSFTAALSKMAPVPRTIGGSSFCWRPKTTISERRVRDTWTKGGPSESTT